jgi:hypothetical protein
VPDGFIALPSGTFAAYALLRSSIASGSEEDVAAAVAYGKTVRVYPLADADDPPATTFHDVADVLFDATIPYDLRFFEALDRFVQAEPWQARDKAMIDMLKSAGICKGTPFAPGDPLRRALAEAAVEGREWLDAQYERFFDAPFFPQARWTLLASAELVQAASTGYTEADSYPVDSRGGAYYWAFSAIKHMGAGQFYLMTTRDADGQPFGETARWAEGLDERAQRRHHVRLVLDHRGQAHRRRDQLPGRLTYTFGPSPGLRPTPRSLLSCDSRVGQCLLWHVSVDAISGACRWSGLSVSISPVMSRP